MVRGGGLPWEASIHRKKVLVAIKMVRGERDIKPKAPGVSLHALGLAPGSTGMGSALPGACPRQYPLAALPSWTAAALPFQYIDLACNLIKSGFSSPAEQTICQKDGLWLAL